MWGESGTLFWRLRLFELHFIIPIPFSVLFLFLLNGGIAPALHQPSAMSLIDCLEENSRFQEQSCFLAVAPLYRHKAAGCETSLLCPPVAAAVKYPLSSVSNWSHLLLLFHNELSSQVWNTKRGFGSFCLQHMQLVPISCSHCKSFFYIIGQCKYRQIMQWYHLLKLLCLRFRIIGVPQI